MNAFVLLALIALSGAAQAAGKPKDHGVAGTYELLVCKGECSFTDGGNVLRTAVIVLFDRAMKRKDTERVNSTYQDLKSNEVRACYTLTYPDRRVSGVTAWSLDRKTLSFTLVHSKDSWYSIRVERNGDLLKGVGNFWSAGVAPPPGFVPDTIVGRRRGPADITACKAEAKG